MEVVKQYNYEKDGKTVVIKRSYTVKGTKGKKINELDEYFTKNADSIKNSKKLKDVLDVYNSKHDNKISFSMLYQKYKTVFGNRRCKAVKIDMKVIESEEDEHE